MVCFDIPVAYMHADTYKYLIMVFEGPLTELMVKAYPSFYRKYVPTNSKGNPLIYFKIHKKLYGRLRSVLMFQKNLVKYLEDYGFETNKYDPCVANKTVNGSHMTFFWPVDDLKVSH